jgi:alpha-L-rhamnosidase
MLPGVRSVLSWFEDKVDETGLVGPLPWWPFADWADEWGGGGMAPGGKDGHSILITLQYAYALQRAVELERKFGVEDEADRLQNLANTLLDAARDQGWDADRGLFRDSLEVATFSQHTNTMAILTGAAPDGEQRAIVERILEDKSLIQAGYYFSFYIHEAVREAGLAHRYIEQLKPWQDMLALGLTTTPEKPPPSRTDSHAWAAHPNYGLLATVLGIRPAAPGFTSVEITPELGPLQKANGTMPHPLGDIKVSLQRVDQDGIEASITLPEGLEGVLNWQGETINLKSGTQEIRP